MMHLQVQFFSSLVSHAQGHHYLMADNNQSILYNILILASNSVEPVLSQFVDPDCLVLAFQEQFLHPFHTIVHPVLVDFDNVSTPLLDLTGLSDLSTSYL